MLAPGVGRMGIWDDEEHGHQPAGSCLTSAPAVTPELPSQEAETGGKGRALPAWGTLG